MSLTDQLRLVLIDDHRVFRDGLRAVLSQHPGLIVVGEAADARTGYAVVETTRPDVAVVDISLPGVDGVVATRELCRRCPSTRVLILTAYARSEQAAQALEAGAQGYAVKDQSADEIVAAVRAVARGERYVAPQIATQMAEDVASRGDGSAGEALAKLSPREREIFDLIIRGFSNEGIGHELSISVKTVETHRAHINKKLQVHSTADLVRFAARKGLIRD